MRCYRSKKPLTIPPQEGTLSQILLYCPALSQPRSNMIRLWSSFMVSRPLLLPIISIEEPECMVQLILTPTCLPLVVSCKESAPVLQRCLYLRRTWCLSNYTLRSRLLKENNLKWQTKSLPNNSDHNWSLGYWCYLTNKPVIVYIDEFYNKPVAFSVFVYKQSNAARE